MRAHVAILAFLATLFIGLPAFAQQNITIVEAQIDRSGAGHDGDLALAISRSDCESDETFSVPFTTEDVSGVATIDVWLAGNEGLDCAAIEARDGDEENDCTLVTSVDAEQSGSVVITSSQLANAVPNVGPNAGLASCQEQGNPSGAPHNVTLFFLMTRTAGSDIPGEDVATWSTVIDLVGPAPPTELEAKSGEESVKLEFTASTGEVKGYFVYCAPPEGGGTTTGAGMGGMGGGVTTGGGMGGAGGGVGGGGVGGGMGGDGGAGGMMTTVVTATVGSTTSGTTTGATTSATTGGGGEGGGSGVSGCESSVLQAGLTPPGPEFRCAPSSGNVPLTATNGLTVQELVNGEIIGMAVAAVDDLGNPGVLSEVVCGEPRPVDDFWDQYRAAGGKGGGGFCSAAAYGPGAAGSIALGALALAAAGGLALRRRRKRASRGGSLLLGVLFALAIPSAAHAQGGIPDSNWRQDNRHREDAADTQFAFEIRFGPYWPAVDEEPGLTGEPYKRTFGTDANFYFGLEFDYMPLRIPYLGTVGPGIGWGYTWASDKAAFTGCTPADDDADGVPDYIQDDEVEDACKSEDTTSLTIMPMHLSAVLRADELMRRTGVPIVPYAKFGPAVGIWMSEQSSGTSEVEENGEKIKAEGLSWGLHAALGAAFALNFLDAQSAGRMRESTGIGHVYIFAEWMGLFLNGFGNGKTLYAGTNTVVAGLAADF